jgi:ankyrin repeat protein
MKAALKSSPIGPDAINELLHWLGPLANKLVNTDDLDVNEQPLMGSCNGVQTRQFVQRNALLAVAARGRLAEICEAVEVDPEVVSFRDSEGRSLLWKAASRNRVPLVEYLLQRGANIHLPACDPAVTNLACSSTARLGTPSRARVAKAVCSASS